MSANVTRREFVETLTAASAISLPLSGICAAAADRDDEFSCLLLGDTHFDRIEHHDLAWMREHFTKAIPQVENYCRHTQDVLPKLLSAAKQSLLNSPLSKAFVLHVGDLVEGICGNEQLAEQHCREAWDFIERMKFGVPFVMTKGNHDITGPGAAAAFQRILLAKTAEQLRQDKPDRALFTFRRGGNLFVVFDAYDQTAIDWLEKIVNGGDFQRLFVLLHMPVVPYNARSNWRVYWHPKQAERRQRLVNLLGRHRAIVLSGHLHKHAIVVRECEEGRFVQLGLSSIIGRKAPPEESSISGVESYGPDLTDLEPNFDVESREERRIVLANEKPHISHFEYSQSAGYAALHISGTEVNVDFYHWPDVKPWKQLAISTLLK